MPNQAAWPKLGIPPGPIMKCKLAANSISTSASVSTARAYVPATSGTASASSSAAAPSTRRAMGAGRMTGTRSGAVRASATGRPSSPFGRTTSTAAMMANTSTSVAFGTSATPNACNSPISSAAR